MHHLPPLFVALALMFVIGCAAGDQTLGPPDHFQNIKLGMTSAQLTHMSDTETVGKNVYRINTPTDKIEFIDCYFNKNGEHLFEIEITHYEEDPANFEKFIHKCGQHYGEFASRRQHEVEGFEHEVLEVVWRNKHVKYEVEGRRYGKQAEKLVIVERMRDVGFLETRAQDELNDMYRDRRRMIETGSF